LEVEFYAWPNTITTISVAPEAGTTPIIIRLPTDRADLRPENIQDAVIRLAGNSQTEFKRRRVFWANLPDAADQDVMTS